MKALLLLNFEEAQKQAANEDREQIIKAFEKDKRKRSLDDLEIIIRTLLKTKLIDIFKDLKNDKINFNINLYNIAKNIEHHCAKRGETVFRIGEKGDKFYIIIKGSIQILKIISNLKELSIEDYLENMHNLIKTNENHLVRKMLLMNRERVNIEKEKVEVFLRNLFLKRLKAFLIGYPKILEIEFFFEKYGKKISDYNLHNIYNLDDSNSNENAEFTKFLKAYLKSDKLKLQEENLFKSFLDNPDEIKKFTLISYESFLALEEGQFFGDYALDSNTNRTATLIAREPDTHLAIISKEIYNEYILKEKIKLTCKYIEFIYNSFFEKFTDKYHFEQKYFGLFIYEEHFKNEVLIREAEEFDFVYFILEGNVDLHIKKSLNQLVENIKSFIGLDYEVNKEVQGNEDLKQSLKKYKLNNKNYKGYEAEFKMIKNYTIKSISKNEIFGLENLVYKIPSSYTAVITSSTLSTFKIETKVLRGIINTELDAKDYIKGIANKKIINLIWRLAEIKKNYLDLLLFKTKENENEVKLRFHNHSDNKNKNESFLQQKTNSNYKGSLLGTDLKSKGNKYLLVKQNKSEEKEFLNLNFIKNMESLMNQIDKNRIFLKDKKIFISSYNDKNSSSKKLSKLKSSKSINTTSKDNYNLTCAEDKAKTVTSFNDKTEKEKFTLTKNSENEDAFSNEKSNFLEQLVSNNESTNRFKFFSRNQALDFFSKKKNSIKTTKFETVETNNNNNENSLVINEYKNKNGIAEKKQIKIGSDYVNVLNNITRTYFSRLSIKDNLEFNNSFEMLEISGESEYDKFSDNIESKNFFKEQENLIQQKSFENEINKTLVNEKSIISNSEQAVKRDMKEMTMNECYFVSDKEKDNLNPKSNFAFISREKKIKNKFLILDKSCDIFNQRCISKLDHDAKKLLPAIDKTDNDYKSANLNSKNCLLGAKKKGLVLYNLKNFADKSKLKIISNNNNFISNKTNFKENSLEKPDSKENTFLRNLTYDNSFFDSVEKSGFFKTNTSSFKNSSNKIFSNIKNNNNHHLMRKTDFSSKNELIDSNKRKNSYSSNLDIIDFKILHKQNNQDHLKTFYKDLNDIKKNLEILKSNSKTRNNLDLSKESFGLTTVNDNLKLSSEYYPNINQNENLKFNLILQTHNSRNKQIISSSNFDPIEISNSNSFGKNKHFFYTQKEKNSKNVCNDDSSYVSLFTQERIFDGINKDFLVNNFEKNYYKDCNVFRNKILKPIKKSDNSNTKKP